MEKLLEKLEFSKFTSYGNNFVVVDETQRLQLHENEKSAFSCQVANVNFGVGADGVLFLQPYRSDVLAEINKIRHYWDKLPLYSHLDVIFRIFEPNGVESFSCGNGLMCLANYLNRKYRLESTRILTQIPTAKPKVITIGTDSLNGRNWANLGSPRRIPRDVVSPSDITSLDDDIDTIYDISITFREGDLHPFSNRTSLKLNGYLVYTGEPHMVIFPETGFSIKELQKFFFIYSNQTTPAINSQERRIRFGSWLIDHIGMQLNKQYPHIFPNGINVNFVNIPAKNNVIEYRCFERGINKETLACGTGALASSFVSQRLGLIKEDQVSVWPHRCRWYDPEAFILADQNKQQWSLYGKPVMLLEGMFTVDKTLARRLAAVEAENTILDHGHQLEPENIQYLANGNH